MPSARSERDAFAGSLLYSFLNYTVQVWPWILTALCGLVLFGSIEDPQQPRHGDQERSWTRSSRVMLRIKLLSARTIASANRRFDCCSSRTFSSTVSREISE